MKNITFLPILLLTLLFISACSSGSYYSYSNTLKNDLVNSHKNQSNKEEIKPKTLSAEQIEKEEKRNKLLFYQESGLYSFLKGDYKNAIGYLNKADQEYKNIDIKSKAELNKPLSYTVLDDNSLTYEGSDYERALVHYYKALSYLAQGDLQGSLVEFRASSQAQKFASHLRRKKINKAEREARQQGIKNKLKESAIASELQIASLKSKFLNANAYYISGHVREMQGDKNSALVDYKKALEIEPQNSYYIKDAYRLAKIYDLSYANYLAKNSNIKQEDLDSYVLNYNKSNKVLVIQEQGFIPVKSQDNIVMLIDYNYIKLPFPYYRKNFVSYPATLSLLNKNGETKGIYSFDVASNIFRLEYSNLAEQYPLIITRSITRQATSTFSISQLSRQSNEAEAIRFLSSVVLESFEQADLRSWRNLPASILVAKANVNNNEDLYIKTSNLSGVTIKNDELGFNSAQKSLTIVYVYSIYNGGHKKDIYKILSKWQY